MRPPAILLVSLSLGLSACVTAGGAPNGWAGGRPAAPAEVTRREPSRPRAPEAARRVPPPSPRTSPGPAYPTLVIPVEGVEADDLRDSFLSPRSNGRTHHAIDISAPLGTPVLAATDGEVSRMHWNALGGRTLYLTDGRFDYYYAHLDSYADGLEIGRRVRRGDVLGAVGQTGNARSPHLHFQVLDRDGEGRGTPFNPYELLRNGNAVASR